MNYPGAEFRGIKKKKRKTWIPAQGRNDKIFDNRFVKFDNRLVIPAEAGIHFTPEQSSEQFFSIKQNDKKLYCQIMNSILIFNLNLNLINFRST